MNSTTFDAGSAVLHPIFKRGIVELDKGATVLVRFAHGIEECEKALLECISTVESAYLSGQRDVPATVLLKLMAETIVSINAAWGVFSPSRIELLPHQLWVCRKVMENWPARWVVADDVGLGKTIEAGLVLWPLLASGKVRRLLILCPASLVKQWQWRLLKMFDIRVAEYHPDLDSSRSDFWNICPVAVASLQTLRADNGKRHERMLAAEPWDLVIVDEAHHLNYDEDSGMTLGYSLLRKLQEANKFESLLLFTGTPHRGKQFGFFALMSLVRPDLFSPRKSAREQYGLLQQALIRNNKYSVTDLKGRRLFQQPKVHTENYRYSPEEARFYAMLTDFIASGKAYALSLEGRTGRAVMLVLIALQKLASSSVAAIHRAMVGRVERLKAQREVVQKRLSRDDEQALQSATQFREEGDEDALNEAEEDKVARLFLQLMDNERTRLEELIQAATEVRSETKIEAILRDVRALPTGESVLFFTEYKATQALLISGLWREFGEGCVTFINGDEMLPEVLAPEGIRRTLRISREDAADRFNSGTVRFLVSTEAAGEGIDLQEHCHRLVHVDLPWNPMRLHQRVGRLNRIGQNEKVKVTLYQNPETVESRIWTLLNQKLADIAQALNAAMEEPEDLMQLVLGISSPGLVEELFAEAGGVGKERFSTWFDQKTAQFGGKDAVELVQSLLGQAQRFDFQQASALIPKVDLPALKPFFRLALRWNKRQVSETNGKLSFKTPDLWTKKPGVLLKYESIHFDRRAKAEEKEHVAGVGHKAFDAALEQVRAFQGSVTSTRLSVGAGVLFAFRCFDRVTGRTGQLINVLCGVFVLDSGEVRLLRDWEMLQLLNDSVANDQRLFENGDWVAPDARILRRAEKYLGDTLHELKLPFRQPAFEVLAIVESTKS